jgi:hypothetical protein
VLRIDLSKARVLDQEEALRRERLETGRSSGSLPGVMMGVLGKEADKLS